MKFREIPGQDQPHVERWPSSNTGWRMGVVVGAAVVLSGIILCGMMGVLL